MWPNRSGSKPRTMYASVSDVDGLAMPVPATRSCRATRLSRGVLGEQLFGAVAGDDLSISSHLEYGQSAPFGGSRRGTQSAAGQLRDYFAQLFPGSLGLCPGGFKYIIIQRYRCSHNFDTLIQRCKRIKLMLWVIKRGSS